MSAERISRLIGAVAFALIEIGLSWYGGHWALANLWWIIPITIIFAALGYFVTPHITLRPFSWIRKNVTGTPIYMSSDDISRLIGMVAAGLITLGVIGNQGYWAVANMWWIIPITIIFAALGYLVTPYITLHPFGWLRRQIMHAPIQVLLATMVGLVIGLVFASLPAVLLSTMPYLWTKILAILVTIFMAYIGIWFAVTRGAELWQMLVSHVRGRGAPGSARDRQIILDTSAIIDGRIADISQTGFVQGTLVIPRFVLDELHHIADSPDSVRRNRGRRGLEMLNKLQKESDVPVQVSEIEIEGTAEVDAKLVKLAKALHSPIITNDFNLNRIAELQGVKVLNINELANAIKSVVLPGEEMTTQIIQEGKESGQGVGFLDDGTMVVVEGGRRYLNQHLDVTVTRVLQTAAGRIIFAHPKTE